MAFLDDIKNEIAQGRTFDWEALLERNYRMWIRPGDTVIDVGAHRGRHLGPMWQSVGDTGHVIAFEPLPSIFSDLQANFQASNILLVNAAISTEPGTSPFVFARGTPEESGLRKRIYNRPDEANPTVIQVNTTRLDDHAVGVERLTFIKIDVEGGELICLSSAAETIAKHRPVISVEYGAPSYTAFGNGKDDMHRFAASIDYKIFDLFLNDLSEIDIWRDACDSVYWDYFLVPSEKAGGFLSRCAGQNSTSS